jgi:hypothetical protein
MRVYAALCVLLLLCVAAPMWAETDSGASKSSMVSLELKGVSVRDGIDALFQGTGLKYDISPGVSGKIVELKLKGISFKQALTALVDAAGLCYSIQDGTYVITTKKSEPKIVAPSRVADIAPEQPQNNQPQPENMGPPPAPAAQVQINNNQAPVYYGQPGGYPYYPDYGPPIYRFGNVGIVGGGYPAFVLGGDPYVMSFGQNMVPPPGWVGPDLERFLRFNYLMTPRPYFTTPY